MSDFMLPTPRLRWVRNAVYVYPDERHKLQQLWISDVQGIPDEWRDVPAVEETT